MQGEFIGICMNLLMEVLYAFVVYEYFKTFFDRKNIKGIFIFIYVLSVMVQDVALNLIPGNMDYLRMVIVTLLMIGISCFYEGEMGKKIVFALLFVAMSMLAELLVACVFVACDVSIPVNSKEGYIITYALLIALIKILQYFFLSVMNNMSWWTTNLKITLLPLGSMFLAYHMFYTQYEMGIRGFYWRTIISILILLILNVMMFNIFARLSENLELKRKTSIYEKEFNILEEHMHEREYLIQDFRMKRHDLKHQMLNLLVLLKDENYEELEEDIKKLAELEPLKGLFFVSTENSIIDAFVNSKYMIARKNGIDFQVNLDIPVELPFRGEDLCVILGNAVDNAIEGCLRGTVEKPYVKLELVFDGENLIVVVENSYDGNLIKSKKGNFITRKENVQQHGIGIYSMQNTLRKYNGYYHVETDNRIYHLEMLLHQPDARHWTNETNYM